MSQKETEKEEEHFQEFDELHLDSYNTFSDATEDDFSSFNINDHVFDEGDLDAKYRSIGHSNPVNFNLATQSVPVSKDSSGGLGATVFTRQDAPKAPASASAAAPRLEVISADSSGVKSKPSRPIAAPAEPFYVAPSTHIVTKMNVGDVKARVEVELSSQAGVSFEFFPQKCRWEGVYLSGSTRCKFEFNVYKRSSGGLVVEGNRLSGDSFAFINIYTSVRNLFVPPSDVQVGTGDVFTHTRPLLAPPPRRAVDPVELEKSLRIVLSMAQSGVGESQLSAAQILCNLASDTSKHSALVAAGCVSALVDLIGVDFESCNQHAICALAHLSSSHSCQQVLLRDENFLQTLLPLCCDGNYNSIEMRRECARLLANISSCGGEAGAQQVVACAGLRNVESWLQSVDGLKDERLRLHADRARVSLAPCM